MAKYNFNSELEVTEKKYGMNQSSNWLRLEEGHNRIRILDVPALLPQHYDAGKKAYVTCYGEDKGCPFKATDEKTKELYHPKPSIKWLHWVIDRKDGDVKLARLPHEVNKQIGALQSNPDWTFEELPMPYDVNIQVKNVGTKEVEYAVQGSPKWVALTEEEKKQSESKIKSAAEIVEAMKQKQMKKDGNTSSEVTEGKGYDYPEGESTEIPF